MSEFDQEDLGDVAEIHITGEFDCGYRIKAPEFNELEIPKEFNDYLKVMIPGAEKHGPNSWLTPDGPKTSFREMHDSMFHHLAESFAAGPEDIEGPNNRFDAESGLDPLLHLICRAQMMYTRLKRNIVHKDDK